MTTSASTSTDSTALVSKGGLEIAGVTRTPIVFDASEKSIAKSMDEVTTEEILKFTDTIEAVQGKDILSLMSSLFDFMGFDPLMIIKKLLTINKYYRVEKKIDTETEEMLKIDIMMMVCANIMMGNLQTKSVGRRSAKGRAAIEYLMAKYQMKIGSTGAGLPSDTLTFPRVANSFPVLTCRTAQVLPTKNFQGKPFKTVNVPKFMRTTAFASFCSEDMSEDVRMFLLEVVCAYNCDQLITVHEGEQKKKKIAKNANPMTPLDAYAAQWDYILVSSTSPVPDPKMKRAILAEFLIDNLYSELSDIVKNFRELLEIKTPMPTEQEYQKGVRDFISGVSKAVKNT
jgi:hypothetical protein